MSLNSHNPKNSLLEGLKNGNQKALGRLYSMHYERITTELKYKFPLVDNHEIDTVYVDSCIVVFERAQSGKVIILNNEEFVLYQLLRQICNYKLIDFTRKQKVKGVDKRVNPSEKNSSVLDDENDDEYFIEEIQSDSDIDTVEELCLEKSMKEVGEPCKTILHLKYAEGLSWEEIGEKLELDPGTLRKVTAPRCRAKLKKLIEACSLNNN